MTTTTTTTTRAADIALGDSIALGAGHALHLPTVARVGAGSCEIARWMPRKGAYGTVVLSAGINDAGACVAALRAALRARKVIWIIPADINAAALKVWNVIKVYGDKWVIYDCPHGRCTKSNFHPASYPKVATAIRSVW